MTPVVRPMVDAEITNDRGLEVQLFPVQLHTVASKVGVKTQPYSRFMHTAWFTTFSAGSLLSASGELRNYEPRM